MTTAATIYISAVGLSAPGLDGWQPSLSVLRGEQLWQFRELERYKPEMLPPNERRRATNTVRLAFRACEDALANLPGDKLKPDFATVFSSSGGDYDVIDAICKTLATPAREVSPTIFHNSVHNAPVGYWGIGTGCQLTSSAISAYDASFAAGLLEAVMLLAEDHAAVLLAVYDSLPPSPLSAKRHISIPFASAFVLTRSATQLPALARICVTTGVTSAITMAHQASLENMRLQNPAARCLPLLEAIANQQPGKFYFELPGEQCLQVEVSC